MRKCVTGRVIGVAPHLFWQNIPDIQFGVSYTSPHKKQVLIKNDQSIIPQRFFCQRIHTANFVGEIKKSSPDCSTIVGMPVFYIFGCSDNFIGGHPITT
jgi:hypothetical protein